MNPEEPNLENPPPAPDVSTVPVPGFEAAQTAVAPEPNPLHVKLEAYDGPLDLLLDLIKKNEMNIYDIPIAEITRQYLEYLARMKALDLEIAGEFIVMAATLIYIKSRTLLPQEKIEDDEEGGDPRAELVRKLLEYQAFKEAAKELGLREDERSQIFTRQIADYYFANIGAEEVTIDAFSANLFDLLTAFKNVIARRGPEPVHDVYEVMIPIEDKIAEIKEILLGKGEAIFSSFFKAGASRGELIVTFLATLELVRTKFVIVVQDRQFGEIILRKKEAAA